MTDKLTKRQVDVKAKRFALCKRVQSLFVIKGILYVQLQVSVAHTSAALMVLKKVLS